MTPIDWRRGRTGDWHQDAEIGDVVLGAGENSQRPGYWWFVRRNVMTLCDGQAPTFRAAKRSAERFFARLGDLDAIERRGA